MPQYLENMQINVRARSDYLRAYPCFSSFTADQLAELALKMREVAYEPNERMVIEGDIVDSIFIITSGEAEVTLQVMKKKKETYVPVATLHRGEGIGLNDTGFYSSTGKRTATVTAITPVLTLRLAIKDLHEFLEVNQLESSMYAASLQMVRMRFIKQSLPFSKLSHESLRWLAECVKEEVVPAGNTIFRQGEPGDKCYMVYAGKVEIVTEEEQGGEKVLAVLKPPILFGEATLITQAPRNATARALEETTLLTLDHHYLSELLLKDINVASMFMNLMVDRSRPNQSPNVSMHTRETADGEEVTILKNANNGNYFKLSREGKYIWEHLNGKNTLQEITLNLADEYQVFAPDRVAALISKLTQAGFIDNLNLDETAPLNKKPLLARTMGTIRRLAEYRFAIGDTDPWLTRVYAKGIRYFYTKPAQVVLALITLFGFMSFVMHTREVLLLFSIRHASLWLLISLIPISILKVVLHEFGHAFTVKACGREVHYMGIGWFWAGPIAFTDTSDMWLAARKPRMLANIAGVYVDYIMAGLAALIMLTTYNPYLRSILWLFALYTYIGGFAMLNPLQESDGYYVLMDWLEKTRLRYVAIKWLVKGFPKAIRHPRLFQFHQAEVLYWASCVLYIVLVSILTLILQAFVFAIFGIHNSNRYISLVLPLLVAIASSMNIVVQVIKADD